MITFNFWQNQRKILTEFAWQKHRENNKPQIDKQREREKGRTKALDKNMGK